MASINEILTSEAKTDHSIRLFREGPLFFRAYERSAYLFVNHVRMYEIHHKYFKVCNSDVVWLGFPQKSLPSLGCQYIENADGTVSIPVEAEIDEQQFLQWKAKQASLKNTADMASPLPTVSSPLPLQPLTNENETEALHRLRAYNLAGSTPMETMLFVSELQRMLNKGKGTSV